MAMDAVSATANSSHRASTSLRARAEPTSTGATDADIEKGRVAQNQDFRFEGRAAFAAILGLSRRALTEG
jgi:hypothetical protein